MRGAGPATQQAVYKGRDRVWLLGRGRSVRRRTCLGAEGMMDGFSESPGLSNH